MSEPPGGGVLVNRLRHGAAVSVQRFPRRVDDERGTVGLGVGADRHDALQWPPGLIVTNGPDALVIPGSSGRSVISGNVNGSYDARE